MLLVWNATVDKVVLITVVDNDQASFKLVTVGFDNNGSSDGLMGV